MEYRTIKHKDKNFFVQYDKNNVPVVIYHFGEKEAETHILKHLTVLDEPDYYYLPNLSNNKNSSFDSDYVIDCGAFKGLENPTLVCAGNNIKFIGNNDTTLNLVLAKGQSLFGVQKTSIFNESIGYLVVAPTTKEKFQKYHCGTFLDRRAINVMRLDFGFSTAPKYGCLAGVKVDRSKIYNSQTGEIEDTPQRAGRSATEVFDNPFDTESGEIE